MTDRMKEIHDKGFDMSTVRNISTDGNTDFTRTRVGLKTLTDATLDIGQRQRLNPRMSKDNILRAIHTGDFRFMREASSFYFKSSGIYARLCKHLANFYRYDWQLIPFKISDKVTNAKVIDDFERIGRILDSFGAKQYLGEVALKVMVQGCYYGYVFYADGAPVVQELHCDYCRTRYSIKGRPVVEMNMKFFDDFFKDTQLRVKMLNMLPADFRKGYLAYHEGRLPTEKGDTAGWYVLDPECTVKFNINGEDYPPFVSVIPYLMDLEAAQELDRKKMAQKLLKIIIQKMPFDKNGDLVFDVDEAQELHNNVVKMLGKAIGVDVLTTFADVDVADMADKSSVTTSDELEKVERTVYNESGTAQNLFNTDGNIALEKSILNDEADVYNLLLQFEAFLNIIIEPYIKNPKKLYFKVQMLPTTIYNYKEMSKLYKEQSAAGGSKMLAHIALGQSQSSVIASAKFENDILDITSIFSSKQERLEQKESQEEKEKTEEDNQEAGRPELPDDQKSEKTLLNREAMN